MGWIRIILEYLPKYLADFGSLVSGPKRFLAIRNPSADDTYHESLVFFASSVFLVVVITVPLRPTGEAFSLYLGRQIVTSLLAVSLYAIALRLAWRMVGGKATVRSFFVTYAYLFGVIGVIVTLFCLLGEGVFRVFEPDLYARVIQLQQETGKIVLPLDVRSEIPGYLDSSIPTVSFLLLVAGFLLSSVWSVFAWGAFRRLNGLSKLRSSIAMMIMGPLGWGTTAIVFFVSRALEPTS